MEPCPGLCPRKVCPLSLRPSAAESLEVRGSIWGLHLSDSKVSGAMRCHGLGPLGPLYIAGLPSDPVLKGRVFFIDDVFEVAKEINQGKLPMYQVEQPAGSGLTHGRKHRAMRHVHKIRWG